jgi:hypothetical protein
LKTELTFEDIVLMFDMCRFDAAWDPHSTSVWCAAFDDSDLQVTKFYLLALLSSARVKNIATTMVKNYFWPIRIFYRRRR